MDDLKPHVHNGVDAPEIPGENLVNAPQTTIALVSGTADGTYSSNEQTLINAQTTAINDIITKLKALGLIREQ